MRVLVCGGRNADPGAVWRWLELAAIPEIREVLAPFRGRSDRITVVIHGGARGADEAPGIGRTARAFRPAVSRRIGESTARLLARSATPACSPRASRTS